MVGPPKVINKEVNGKKFEPYEVPFSLFLWSILKVYYNTCSDVSISNLNFFSFDVHLF
jgi:hypothetical protein